jgi:hypothetical protein
MVETPEADHHLEQVHPTLSNAETVALITVSLVNGDVQLIGSPDVLQRPAGKRVRTHQDEERIPDLDQKRRVQPDQRPLGDRFHTPTAEREREREVRMYVVELFGYWGSCAPRGLLRVGGVYSLQENVELHGAQSIHTHTHTHTQEEAANLPKHRDLFSISTGSGELGVRCLVVVVCAEEERARDEHRPDPRI